MSSVVLVRERESVERREKVCMSVSVKEKKCLCVFIFKFSFMIFMHNFFS